MEHAVSLDAVRPWRTAALVASVVAAVELLILIAGGVVLMGRPLTQHAAKNATKPGTKTAATPKPARAALLPRARTSVLVLNGNGEQGAAAAEAALVRARSYPVSAVGNAPSAANGPTLVMYRPGFQAEAKRFARDLGIRVVAPLDGLKTGSLHGARLAVVLGS
jgi:hypothetical protein